MKNLTIITLALTALFVLQGCGSSSKKETTPVVATTPVKPTTPTLPEAVHIIKPEDVAKYVETFTQSQAALELQIEGAKFDISLVDFFKDENIIAASYSNGYLLIGFDLTKNEPIKSLTILESDLAFEDAIAKSKRRLISTVIALEESGDNIIYSGTVTDHVTSGVFNVRLVFNESLISGGSSVIKVEGTKATIHGDLGTKTYVQLSELIANNPEVDTLLLKEISGSVNDEINMHTGRLVRNAQLTTMVEATSDINSGGVDLYAAGFKRVYTEGAKLGVHSWCCTEGKPANELGKDHKGHGAQLTYFREMLGLELGPEFYFFTIEAAPHDSVHVMTQAELDKYLLKQ